VVQHEGVGGLLGVQLQLQLLRQRNADAFMNQMRGLSAELLMLDR
jgi:hypothetical protein